MYRHLSWYKTHQIPKLKRSPSRLAVVFAQPIEARCSVGNEDVVGAAPTTSEWSTIMLIANVRLILEIWRYLLTPGDTRRNNYVVKMTSRRCFDVIMTFLLRRESAGPQHPLTVQTPQRFTYMMTIKWKHFPRYWPFVWGIHRSPVNSPHKGQWRGALMFSLICARINGWVNTREAGDLRRHRAHCDVTVM